MSQKFEVSTLQPLCHNASSSQIKSVNMRRRKTLVWARLVWAYTTYLLSGSMYQDIDQWKN